MRTLAAEGRLIHPAISFLSLLLSNDFILAAANKQNKSAINVSRSVRPAASDKKNKVVPVLVGFLACEDDATDRY